jgi:hypothetical protein
MIDYLNPHHVYIDAHNAPDLSVEVKRDEAQNMRQLPATIVPKTVEIQHKSARFYESSVSYDTAPAADCPVCGGMYKGESCEMCGYDGELIRENVGKDAINRYCMYGRKPVEVIE